MIRKLLGLLSASLLALMLTAPALAQEQGGPNVATAQVTVAATATLVANFRSARLAVTIQNHGTTEMFCGPSSAVLTTTGFRLPGVDGASVTIPSTRNIYCITASGTQAVSVLESY